MYLLEQPIPARKGSKTRVLVALLVLGILAMIVAGSCVAINASAKAAVNRPAAVSVGESQPVTPVSATDYCGIHWGQQHHTDIIAYKLCEQALYWDPRDGLTQIQQCRATYPKVTSVHWRMKLYTCLAWVTDRLSV